MNVLCKTVVMLSLAGCLVGDTDSHAEDWPLVRGDVQGTGVARSELIDPLELLWQKKLGGGIEATAVISGSLIYIGDVEGTFYAVRLANGEIAWSKSFEAGFLAGGAAVKDGRVFVGDFDGIFRCLDAKTGALIWKFQADAEFYAGPTLHEKNVLFTCDDGTLFCLDAASGEKRWVFSIEQPLRCSPTIDNGLAALAGCDSRLHLVDVTTGREVDGLDLNSQTGATPAMANGRTYFGTESGTFYCLELSPLKLAWTYRDPRRGQPIQSAAAVTDKLVVYGSEGKHVYALDPKSGKLKWKLPMKDRIASSPILSGDRVFIATTKGRLVAANALTGKETWRYDAGDSFIASPAVSVGRLVIGNDNGTLYCFGSAGE